MRIALHSIFISEGIYMILAKSSGSGLSSRYIEVWLCLESCLAKMVMEMELQASDESSVTPECQKIVPDSSQKVTSPSKAKSEIELLRQGTLAILSLMAVQVCMKT